MGSMVENLKKKWNIETNTDFFLIMLVFSLAGMSIVFERRPLFHTLGITAKTPLAVKTLLYLATVPFLYQLNLLFFGFLLGKFEFFWEKEKKIGRFFKRIFN